MDILHTLEDDVMVPRKAKAVGEGDNDVEDLPYDNGIGIDETEQEEEQDDVDEEFGDAVADEYVEEQEQDQPEMILKFEDHYTIKKPSSKVRFRGTSVRVYDRRTSQLHIITESSGRNKNKTIIQVSKATSERTFGLNFLRFLYILFCLLFAGILFIFCFLVLFYQFMNLVAVLNDEANNVSKGGAEWVGFFGTLLAIPMFIYGLASAMSVAGAFIKDTWSGHVFLRHIGGKHGIIDQEESLVATEWAAFLVFLGIPVMVGMITLFLYMENWWEITALTWFGCVAAYYLFFAGAVLYYEMNSTLGFLQSLDPRNDEGWKGMLRRAILIRQVGNMSGAQHVVCLINSKDSSQNNRTGRDGEGTTVERKRTTYWYTRVTRWPLIRRVFVQLDPPERLYSAAEVLGSRTFVTKTTWSLERVFCIKNRSQTVNVVRGPSALLPSQLKSSMACSIIGSLLVAILFVAFIIWFSDGAILIFALIVVVLCCFIPHLQQTLRIYRLYRDVHVNHAEPEGEDEEGMDESEGNNNTGAGGTTGGDDDTTEGMYQIHEEYRVTRPTVGLCWTMFTLEVLCLIIWPIIILFVTRNFAVAALFTFISLVSIVRMYLDPATIIREVGSFDDIALQQEAPKNDPRSSIVTRGNFKARNHDPRKSIVNQEHFKSKARLSSIMLNITRGTSTSVWIWIFIVLAILVLVLSVQAIGTSAEDDISTSGNSTSGNSTSENIVLLPKEDFEYIPQPSLPYPTCRVAKGLDLPFSSNSTGLIDYVFLANMAYQQTEDYQTKLDDWFGEGRAVNDIETVARFRGEVPGGQKAVAYQLISFEEYDFAVVIVRGSTTAWEWLTDAQLWSASAVVVLIRFLLPVGEFFTPILDELLKAVSWVESKTLAEVALYKQTTSFVETLQASGNYSGGIHITGHSLGGGIAIITGAQTGIPAIGVSGPNAMLSRRTFDPPLTKDALNTHVFNIIPERDFVPLVDDPGNLFQRIECRGAHHDVWACHSSSRTLCEVMYQCGTGNRPAICDCAVLNGYPEPTQIGGNQTFTDICGAERSNKG